MEQDNIKTTIQNSKINLREINQKKKNNRDSKINLIFYHMNLDYF